MIGLCTLTFHQNNQKLAGSLKMCDRPLHESFRTHPSRWTLETSGGNDLIYRVFLSKSPVALEHINFSSLKLKASKVWIPLNCSSLLDMQWSLQFQVWWLLVGYALPLLVSKGTIEHSALTVWLSVESKHSSQIGETLYLTCKLETGNFTGNCMPRFACVRAVESKLKSPLRPWLMLRNMMALAEDSLRWQVSESFNRIWSHPTDSRNIWLLFIILYPHLRLIFLYQLV